MARRPARKGRNTARKSRVAGRGTARRTGVRRSTRSARPAARVKRRATASRSKAQTIKIVVENAGPTVGRPDITEEALVSSKIEKGKRRAKL